MTACVITSSCRLVPECRRVWVQRGVPAMTVDQMSLDLACSAGDVVELLEPELAEAVTTEYASYVIEIK